MHTLHSLFQLILLYLVFVVRKKIVQTLSARFLFNNNKQFISHLMSFSAISNHICLSLT